jgi:hypothetical protein
MSTNDIRTRTRIALAAAANGEFEAIEALMADEEAQALVFREMMEGFIVGEQWAIDAVDAIDRHREAESAVAGLFDRLRPST